MPSPATYEVPSSTCWCTRPFSDELPLHLQGRVNQIAYSECIAKINKHLTTDRRLLAIFGTGTAVFLILLPLLIIFIKSMDSNVFKLIELALFPPILIWHLYQRAGKLKRVIDEQNQALAYLNVAFYYSDPCCGSATLELALLGFDPSVPLTYQHASIPMPPNLVINAIPLQQLV